MKVSIFGSTGSVGKTTIEVLQAQSESYDVQVLTANSNFKLLAEQAKALNAKQVVIGDEQYEAQLKELLHDTDIIVTSGQDAVEQAANINADWIMMAITGMVGLKPVLNAIKQGKKVAIANKEPLVAAGKLAMAEAQKSGCTILPVDSEHNAIFQVFEREHKNAIEKIILTASGGPFRTTPLPDMQSITVEQALAHPNWSMGRKISIDSATMMNKALEIIEAHYLFGMPADKIEVLVHSQSVVHSMVEYKDGSVLAQMGASDMATPITNALGYPARLTSPGQKLDLKQMKRLDFDEVDDDKFPAIQLAYQCLEQGQEACIALNAANEVAVSAFLNHKIAFLDIYDIVESAVNNRPKGNVTDLDSICDYDNIVRKSVESTILSGQGSKTASL